MLQLCQTDTVTTASSHSHWLAVLGPHHHTTVTVTMASSHSHWLAVLGPHHHLLVDFIYKNFFAAGFVITKSNTTVKCTLWLSVQYESCKCTLSNFLFVSLNYIRQIPCSAPVSFVVWCYVGFIQRSVGFSSKSAGVDIQRRQCSVYVTRHHIPDRSSRNRRSSDNERRLWWLAIICPLLQYYRHWAKAAQSRYRFLACRTQRRLIRDVHVSPRPRLNVVQWCSGRILVFLAEHPPSEIARRRSSIESRHSDRAQLCYRIGQQTARCLPFPTQRGNYVQLTESDLWGDRRNYSLTLYID